MKILYVSCLCSYRVKETSTQLSSAAVQKFHAAIVSGFIENGSDVDVLSSTPSVGGIDIENEGGIKYRYITRSAGGFKRYISLLKNSYKETRKFLKENKDGIVICDVLNVMISTGAMLAARGMKRKIVGIVTDLPGMMVGNHSSYFNLPEMLNKWMIKKFTHYVLLTEAMNYVVNPKHCPYIVMEGIADTASDILSDSKNRRKVIIYAGGMHERYGVKKLIDAFVMLGRSDFELHLYGNGDTVEYAKTLASKGVIYMGLQPNRVVMEDEKDAWLLINPRPTDEEFTKYSFPSKNIEYMLSGTPLLTTKLPGMPEEYYPYVYLVDDESVTGIATRLIELMQLSQDEITYKGKIAKSWIEDKKNNITQTKKILSLINVEN